MNYNHENFTNEEGLTKSQKIIIISLMIIFLSLLLLAIYKRSGSFNNPSYNTRTVMIYLDGNDLESEEKIATSELKSLNPSLIDLNKTNILIYTGGTKEWHNFIKNDENAIYILKENGFEKLESYPKKNMGDPDTLSQFLKYSYDNYKADNYNLIFFDHGGAIEGAIYDELTLDHLSLFDIATAFKNSPFNKKNKLQTVAFRTCLNGTIEVATVLSEYSKYMIASEEITYGKSGYNVLGFLNNVAVSDSGIDFGKKFIESYKKQIEEIDVLGINNFIITYSIIDLSKIEKVNQSINSFFKDINISSNYAKIAKVRSNLFQYGKNDIPRFDMVDIYDLIYNIKDMNINAYNKLSDALTEAVVYNYTNLDSSHGLSIYFPYNEEAFMNLYRNVVNLKEYGNFIKEFNDMKKNQQNYAFNMSINESKVEDNNIIKFKLTKEQVDVFGHATATIVKKDDEHEGYYYYLYSTNDVELDDSGYLNVKFNNRLIKAIDKDGKESYIRVIEDINDNKKVSYTSARLIDEDKKESTEIDSLYKSTVVYFQDVKGEPKISYAVLSSRNELANGTLIDMNEIEYIDLPIGPVKMIDNNGKYTSDYESAPILYFHESKIEDLKLVWSSLDKEGEYYYVFTIYDINNNHYDSDLIKIE